MLAGGSTVPLAQGGLMTYAMEVAPPGQLGVISAGLKVTSGAGTMVGSAVAALMHAAFTPAQLLGWAWRLPFLGALPARDGCRAARGQRRMIKHHHERMSTLPVNHLCLAGN